MLLHSYHNHTSFPFSLRNTSHQCIFSHSIITCSTVSSWHSYACQTLNLLLDSDHLYKTLHSHPYSVSWHGTEEITTKLNSFYHTNFHTCWHLLLLLLLLLQVPRRYSRVGLCTGSLSVFTTFLRVRHFFQQQNHVWDNQDYFNTWITRAQPSQQQPSRSVSSDPNYNPCTTSTHFCCSCRVSRK